jgi:hypothetical protein
MKLCQVPAQVALAPNWHIRNVNTQRSATRAKWKCDANRLVAQKGADSVIRRGMAINHGAHEVMRPQVAIIEPVISSGTSPLMTIQAIKLSLSTLCQIGPCLISSGLVYVLVRQILLPVSTAALVTI